MKGIAGKRVLVTGASSGIGQSIAVRFARDGADVAIHYRSGLEGAKETETQINDSGAAGKTLLAQADLSDAGAVEPMFHSVVEGLGGVDVLINNAGFLIHGDSHAIPLDDFTKVLATNLTGAFQLAQLTIRHLLQREAPGVIVNVSSVHEVIPKPGFAGYSASKGGMRALTQTLALEYASKGIRINAIGPGATITPMNDAWKDHPEKRAEVESHIPMGRAGDAAEMASAAVFLASDEASYITGQTLFVDGGLTLYPEFASPWSTQ